MCEPPELSPVSDSVAVISRALPPDMSTDAVCTVYPKPYMREPPEHVMSALSHEPSSESSDPPEQSMAAVVLWTLRDAREPPDSVMAASSSAT